MSDGIRLKNLFTRHNVNVDDVAKNAKLTPRSIYRYMILASLKSRTVDKLLTAAGIDKKEWDNYFEENPDQLKEPAAAYKTTGRYHQGTNLHAILQTKGINTTAFADQLNIARRTLYRYFDEKELPAGVLMQAAEILNLPITEIKGLGNTKESFEKDIYTTLLQMSKSLNRIEKHLQLAD